jgi:hypothetical protein
VTATAAAVALAAWVASEVPALLVRPVWPELTPVTPVCPVRSVVTVAPVVSAASVESAVPQAVRVV